MKGNIVWKPAHLRVQQNTLEGVPRPPIHTLLSGEQWPKPSHSESRPVPGGGLNKYKKTA